MTSRPAESPADLATATEIMTDAFAADPVWGGWAFPIADPQRRSEARRRWWKFNLGSAMRYPWVWLEAADGAATVWIPPGGVELTPQEEAEVEPLLSELVGDHAPAFLEGLTRFADAHPREQPHFYLSLLGTDSAHRGEGLGMRLLAENLALIDAEAMPCYLESSNSANLDRYQSVGFRSLGSFTLPDGGPTVDTMWREAANSRDA